VVAGMIIFGGWVDHVTKGKGQKVSDLMPRCTALPRGSLERHFHCLGLSLVSDPRL